MGGRGASSGLGGGAGAAAKNFNVPKVTGKQLARLGRKQLESLATAISANDMMGRGLSQSESVRRATSLIDGNSDAQLRKYISKYGKKYWE